MTTSSPTPYDRLRWLGSEIMLGTFIALLSIFTGVASFQGSLSDSNQNKFQFEGMQSLTDANAEYLVANQQILFDYTSFDSWNLEDDEETAEYYVTNFSDALVDSLETGTDFPFSDQYYEAMYKDAEELFSEADRRFKLANDYNARGDRLQLVVLITAIGLAFAAWASLLDDKSNMRVIFSVMALITTFVGIAAYLTVPTVVG